MTILALDLTSPLGSLALAQNRVLLEEFRLEAPGGYGEVVFAAIDSLLRRHSFTAEDMDRFATASGPGTFTGVRMGLALAQGLAEALRKPVCAISNLQALASLGTGPLRHPVIDARRGQYYTAVYASDGTLVEPECLRDLTRIPDPLYQTGPLAGAIAALAATCAPQDPALLEPNYIRRSDAELSLTVRPLLPPHM